MGFVAVATVDDEEDDCEEASAVISIPPKKPPGGGGGGAVSRGSKKAQRSGSSNIYSAFSQKQIGEFKEGFHIMDEDKDGIIGKSDLRATYNYVGSRCPGEDVLNEMLAEGEGPMNFTMLVTLFANKMSGPADDDDVVINAFKCFDDGGKIEAEKFRQQLVTFGDVFTEEEIDAVFDNLDMDGRGRFETRQLIAILTGRDGDECSEVNEATVVSYQREPDEEEEVTFTL